MASTTYTISVQAESGEFEDRATRSKKSVAFDLATQIRKDEKRATRVTTSAGNVVFEMKARKPQKRTKPYTRVVELPEGFVVPEGKRVAYTRLRKGCAILHDFEEQYWVYDLKTNDVLASFGTTRACGRFLADSVKLDDEGRVLVTE